MLLNTSNYRPGNKHLFINDGKTIGFEVIKLGFKSIELKRLDNGFVKVYNTNELSVASKKEQRKFKESLKKETKESLVSPVIEEKPITVVAEKPVKVVKTKPENKNETPDNAFNILGLKKLIGDEKTEDYKFWYQCTKWQLRKYLNAHGFNAPIDMPMGEITALIGKNLKNNPDKK